MTARSRSKSKFTVFRERPGYHYICPEQTAITTILSGMDAELAALEARRDKTRVRKLGMRQERLTGWLDLGRPTRDQSPYQPVARSSGSCSGVMGDDPK